MEVVLDELVIDRAFGSSEEQHSTLSLLAVIKEVCHVIIVTPGLLGRYYRKLKQYERAVGANSRGFLSMKLFAQFLANGDKTDCRDDPGDIAGLDMVNADDRETVAAALATPEEKAVVTADQKLIDELAELSLSERHPWTMLLPEQALERLSE